MATQKLTQTAVDKLRPGRADRFIWDTELAGFGVKVTPTGRRVFLLQYRALGGRRSPTKRLTIGSADVLRLEAARAQAKRELARVTQGEDPASARKSEREAETFAEAVPLFLEEIAAKRKATTAYEWTRILGGEYEGKEHRGYVLSDLGTMRVRDIEAKDVAKLHRRIATHGAGRTAPKRPGKHYTMANRVLAVLGGLFSWCEARGLRPRGTNPATHVERFPEHERERYLTGDELRRLSDALVTAETVGLMPAERMRKRSRRKEKAKHRPKSADTPRRADPVAVAAIRFLTFTGFREQEALSLRWDAIDTARGIVTLSDTKTAKSVRPLGAPALTLLATLPREGVYVFPGWVEGQPRKEVRRLWSAAREAAGMEDVRLHDLRHTVASYAASGGASLPMVAALLGHKGTKSTQRYAHLFDDARRGTADRAAGDIEAAMLGRGTAVTPLRAAR